ncbi:MAG: hypothetical protein M5U34_00785 [Chloroflexi bacterium]|nr:hypothetical protein [Chloroflexota bacterium]
MMKGFQELYDMGLVDKLPQMGCFQSAGCAPMATSFHKGLAIAENVDDPITDITTLSHRRPR